jgi:hypothetical protein
MLRAIMDISAPAVSLAVRPRTGHLGHQGSQAPGRPILHFVSSFRRPRQGNGTMSWLSPDQRLVSALLEARSAGRTPPRPGRVRPRTAAQLPMLSRARRLQKSPAVRQGVRGSSDRSLCAVDRRLECDQGCCGSLPLSKVSSGCQVSQKCSVLKVSNGCGPCGVSSPCGVSTWT